jgi:hypothetical protein
MAMVWPRLFILAALAVLVRPVFLQGPAWAQGPVRAPVPAQGPAGNPPPPAEREFLYRGEATSILGRQVFGPTGEVIGRIVDVLVGDAGMPRAAVVDFGGFLGVGNRRVAVSWSALRFNAADGTKSITLEMTLDQIRAIPQFRPQTTAADPPATVAVPPQPVAAPAARP